MLAKLFKISDLPNAAATKIIPVTTFIHANIVERDFMSSKIPCLCGTIVSNNFH